MIKTSRHGSGCSRAYLLRSPLLIAGFLGSLLSFAGIAQDELDKASDTVKDTVAAESQSQARINKTDDETQALLDEYLALPQQKRSLEQYVAQLERYIESQRAEQKSLVQQVKAIKVTSRDVLPLLNRMVRTLDQFIDRDLPFQEKQRRKAITELKALLNRAEVNLADKYRAVMQAYQDENAYGRSLAVYRQDIDYGDGEKTVEILRVGRLGLYYQSLDGRDIGSWNREVKEWEELPDRFRASIRQGLRMAKNQIAPVLLELPMPDPETVKRELELKTSNNEGAQQ